MADVCLIMTHVYPTLSEGLTGLAEKTKHTYIHTYFIIAPKGALPL